MTNTIKVFFLLFSISVLSIPALCATQPPQAPREPAKDPVSRKRAKMDLEKEQTINVSMPSKEHLRDPLRASKRFFSHKEALSVQLGVIQDSSKTRPVLDMNYSQRLGVYSYWELEALAQDSGLGQIVISLKKFRPPQAARRFFYKGGLGVRLRPQLGLAAFADWNQWHLQLGAGLENQLQDSQFLRMDLTLKTFPSGIEGLFLLGVAWNS